MKLFYKIIIFALIFALASPFLIKDPNGQPLWDINLWFQQAKRDTERSLDSIQQSVKQTLSSDDMESSEQSSASQPSGLYRYRDDNGKWVYTDQKPEGSDAESVTLKEEVATLKSITLPEGFGESKSKETKIDTPNLQQNGLPLTTAPLSELPKTMKNLEAIQKKFDQRQQDIDNATR